MAGALFAVGCFVFLIILLIRLPSHEEQIKFKKMLRRESAVAHRQIANKIVALPVNVLPKQTELKKIEDKLYMALKSDDLYSDEEIKGYSKLKSKPKKSHFSIEMQEFNKR